MLLIMSPGSRRSDAGTYTLLLSFLLDILAINETRLDSTIADKDISIIGYNVVRKDRNRHRGEFCYT